jgi:hypothetical protein
MAAITFNAAHQKELLRKRLKAVLTALREGLEAFVSNRMRRAAAEADHVRSRRPVTRSNEFAMADVQVASPSPIRSAPARKTTAVDGKRSGTLPAEEPARVGTRFFPLDPGILSEAIPAFFIGRNKEGFWVARDAKGQIGGIFLLESSALSFARSNSRPAGCATIHPSERFELDLDNKGNPLVEQLGLLTRLATRGSQRMTAFIEKMTEAVKRGLKDF